MRHCLLVLSAAAVVLTTALSNIDAAQAPNSSGLTVTVKSRGALQPGEVAVLTVTATRDIDQAQVHVFDREFPGYRVDAKTWRVLVGVDLETTAGSYSARVEADHLPPTSVPLRVVPAHFRTRNLTVDEAFVNPPPEALKRIAQETAEMNELWTHSAMTRLWTSPFVRPVPDPANSAFGTRSILNGQPRSPHSGADFISPAGTVIKSPSGGHVVLAGDRYYTGNTVVIDHGLTLFSLFAHLSEMQVKVGDEVKTGDVIGKVGATGRVTGPHLHWSVRLDGTRIDPLSLLAVIGEPAGRK